MVRDQANERLVSDLGSDSQYLDLLHTTFCERTISIYETKLSSNVEESKHFGLSKFQDRSNRDYKNLK